MGSFLFQDLHYNFNLLRGARGDIPASLEKVSQNKARARDTVVMFTLILQKKINFYLNSYCSCYHY